MSSMNQLRAVVGYLNFSDGESSPAFLQAISEQFEAIAQQFPSVDPGLPLALNDQVHLQFLSDLKSATLDEGQGKAWFGDIERARSAVSFVADHLMPGYREYHAIQLAHVPPGRLWQPLMLGRMFESALRHSAIEDLAGRTKAVITELNDFVGYRPVAVLENNQHNKPYPHEYVRPIPIYTFGSGSAYGPYRDVVNEANRSLSIAGADLVHEAGFTFSDMEELAVDPRAYDFLHPVHQRPGHQFGEWDTNQVSTKGRYTRYVLRTEIIDAITRWAYESGWPIEDSLFASGAALAGTIMLASGIGGTAPGSHQSTISLSTLVPKMAGLRDKFYRLLLGQQTGVRRELLEQDAKATGQPFGGIRQHLNHTLARTRAIHLQADKLSEFFARLGYTDESTSYVQNIETPAHRIRCELRNLLALGRLEIERGQPSNAIAYAYRFNELLLQGIEVGALVDPWNILGFQGNFSLFPSVENSIYDHRCSEMVEYVRDYLHFAGKLLRNLDAPADQPKRVALQASLKKFAAWWDQFATTTVSGIPHVQADEATNTISAVAEIIHAWKTLGPNENRIAFWKKHADLLVNKQAITAILDALVERQDETAAISLLMHWLGQERPSFDDQPDSFSKYAIKWMSRQVEMTYHADREIAAPARKRIAQFFDLLSVNAEELCQAPKLSDYLADFRRPEPKAETSQVGDDDEHHDGQHDDEDDSPYASAYEGVTYKDSTDDGVEGSLAEGGGFGIGNDDQLNEFSEQLRRRLDFLMMLGRLWEISTSSKLHKQDQTDWSPQVRHWAEHCAVVEQHVRQLMDDLSSIKISKPNVSQTAIMEYDRQISIRDEMIHYSMEVSLRLISANRMLLGMTPVIELSHEPFAWSNSALQLVRMVYQHDTPKIQLELPHIYNELSSAKLLFVPLSRGGKPREIHATRGAREFLKQLSNSLPFLGLYVSTFEVLEFSVMQERAQPGDRVQVTEFNLMFPASFRRMMQHAIRSIGQWKGQQPVEAQIACIESLAKPFSSLWKQYLAGVRLSELERRRLWDDVVRFIKKYGRELFTQSFLAYANIRGILNQGVSEFLAHLDEDEENTAPQLLEDLGQEISQEDAADRLEFILRAIVENYDLYKEYNSITTQSDYGENLYILLKFLRLSADYERQRVLLEPELIVHELLAREGWLEAAELWHAKIRQETSEQADRLQRDYANLQAKHTLNLPSIRDRLAERFCLPMQLDRVIAAVRPAVQSARTSANNPELDRLRTELSTFTDSTTGAGLEVPDWLIRLDSEVDAIFYPAFSADSHWLNERAMRLISHDDMKSQIEQLEQLADRLKL